MHNQMVMVAVHQALTCRTLTYLHPAPLMSTSPCSPEHPPLHPPLQPWMSTHPGPGLANRRTCNVPTPTPATLMDILDIQQMYRRRREHLQACLQATL